MFWYFEKLMTSEFPELGLSFGPGRTDKIIDPPTPDTNILLYCWYYTLKIHVESRILVILNVISYGAKWYESVWL